ncbi:MAG TPA: acyl-CoA dehydrogenase C-terminal domain-containing protein, partial [Rhodopila sp.]
DLAALLAPVVKGMLAEQAYDNTVDAQRVFGGYGYISETGVEQFVRDVRVAAIGEGVTAVQAMDLIRRKLPLNNGGTVSGFLRNMETTLQDSALAGQHRYTDPLHKAIKELVSATEWINGAVCAEPDAAAAAAVDYLHLFGRVALGWIWLRIAAAVLQRGPGTATEATDHGPSATRLALARFYLDRLPAESALRHSRMRLDPTILADLTDRQF